MCVHKHKSVKVLVPYPAVTSPLSQIMQAGREGLKYPVLNKIFSQCSVNIDGY
jgi:hypothetical protein